MRGTERERQRVRVSEVVQYDNVNESAAFVPGCVRMWQDVTASFRPIIPGIVAQQRTLVGATANAQNYGGCSQRVLQLLLLWQLWQSGLQLLLLL